MLRRAIALGIALLILGTACGDDATVGIEPGAGPETVTIGMDQVLEVTLEGNPTTGYTWEVAEEGIVTLIESSHQPNSDATGSPGVTTLRFSPTGTGVADLVLIYHRTWEEDVDPLETRTITVTVTG